MTPTTVRRFLVTAAIIGLLLIGFFVFQNYGIHSETVYH